MWTWNRWDLETVGYPPTIPNNLSRHYTGRADWQPSRVWEIQPHEAQDFWEITSCFQRIYGIYLNSVKKTWMITACNQLDLETLGFWPILNENLVPRHRCSGSRVNVWSQFTVSMWNQKTTDPTCIEMVMRAKCWYLGWVYITVLILTFGPKLEYWFLKLGATFSWMGTVDIWQKSVMSH